MPRKPDLGVGGGGVHGGYLKMDVFFDENPMKMDDIYTYMYIYGGSPHFRNTPCDSTLE